MPLLCGARFSGEQLRNGSHLFLHHSGNNVQRRSVSIGLCLSSRRVWRKPDGCAAGAADAAARRRQSQFGPTGGRRAERTGARPPYELLRPCRRTASGEIMGARLSRLPVFRSSGDVDHEVEAAISVRAAVVPPCAGVPTQFGGRAKHESHPTAVDARHRPQQRDAILCAVRVKLFAEFRVSVLRRSSVPGADVRLVRLWGSARPHNEPLAIATWAASRVTVGRRARLECCRLRVTSKSSCSGSPES
jgi:hypothetical protein